MNKEETLEFLDQQIALEERILGAVEQNTAGLGNMLVKNLLLGIAQDSKKHAIMLSALKALLEGKAPMMDETQRDAIAGGIKAHIELEAEADAARDALEDAREED